jgi:hypothetical protein
VASAPPLVKKIRLRSPGASSQMSRAASERASLAKDGWIVVILAAYSWMAAISFGCW